MRAIRQSTTFVALVAALLAPSAAFAENEAIDADPRPGTSTSLEPGRVTVAFADDVTDEAVTLVVRNSAGKDVTNGVFQVEANNVYANLPYPLPRGVYTVHYRALDDSRVPFGGSFQFDFGTGRPTADHRRWRGKEAIPDVVALPGDDSLASSDGDAGTSDPDDADDDAAPESANPPESSSSTVADGDSEATSDPSGSRALAGGIGLMAVVVAAGAAWWIRRRRHT